MKNDYENGGHEDADAQTTCRRPSSAIAPADTIRDQSILSTDTFRDQSVFDCRRQSLKGLVDVDIRLGRAFPKGNTKFRGKLLSFIRAHHFLVKHVALVTDQNLVDVHVGTLLDQPDPFADAFETAPVGNVIHQQNALGAAEIRRGNRLCFIKFNTKDNECTERCSK